MIDERESDPPRWNPTEQNRMIVLAVLLEGGLAPLALLLGWLLRQPPLQGFSWSARDAAIGALAALPIFVLFRLALRRPVGPLARIKRFLDRELVPLFRGRPVSDLALVSLAAGVGEEMLFRGVIQGALTRWGGPAAGLVLASTLFGLLHAITPAYIVIAGILGAYLGLLWIGTGNLLAPIVAHALYDFLALRDLLKTQASESKPEGSDSARG